MGKTAAPKRRTTKPETDPTEDYLKALQAKQQFVTTALNMGWQMALSFMIPVIIGAWLDRKYQTTPSYTITGIFIAIAASVVVVWKTVKEVNAETAAVDNQPKKVRDNAKSK